MNRGLIRRTGFILLIGLAGAFALARIPLQLGLDLKGGASLILRVKVDGGSAAGGVLGEVGRQIGVGGEPVWPAFWCGRDGAALRPRPPRGRGGRSWRTGAAAARRAR